MRKRAKGKRVIGHAPGWGKFLHAMNVAQDETERATLFYTSPLIPEKAKYIMARRAQQEYFLNQPFRKMPHPALDHLTGNGYLIDPDKEHG